jgi:hypothetical protein
MGLRVESVLMYGFAETKANCVIDYEWLESYGLEAYARVYSYAGGYCPFYGVIAKMDFKTGTITVNENEKKKVDAVCEMLKQEAGFSFALSDCEINGKDYIPTDKPSSKENPSE